jgi:MFS family permease
MIASFAARVRFARALGSRPFALLWIGQAVSQLGDVAYFTALAWTVLLLTHSGTAMGVVSIAAMVPRILFLLVGGVTADRLPRRLVLLWSDIGRAMAVLAVAVLGWLGILELWHLIALSIAFGFADGFFVPAFESIPPQLVQAELLPSANALTGLSRELSVLLGPGLGAIFVAVSGPATAFAFDGLTFVFSALCLLAMDMPQPAKALQQVSAGAPVSIDKPAQSKGGGGMIADVREGLGYVLASSWLWATILIASIGNIGWTGAFGVAQPKLVADYYHSQVWLLGAIATSNGVGSLLGTLVIGHLHRPRRRGLIAYGGILLSSLSLIVFGLPLARAGVPVVPVLASAVAGLGLATFSVIWVTVMQELVPSDKLGRVSSIDWLGSLCMTPVGFAVAGVLTDRVGPAWVFVAAGIMNLALSLLGLTVRGIRELD